MRTDTITSLTVIIFLFTCFLWSASALGQTSEENFDFAFENLELGISALEVTSILGDPMDVQYNGNSFAFQYCINLEGDNKYYVVSFNNYKVSITDTYFIDTYIYNECERCIYCFDEVELKSNSSIEGEFNKRIVKNFQVSRSDLILQLDSIGSIVLANHLVGMKTPLYTNDMFSIQTIVDLINDHPDFTFVLVGHTHSQGADEANLILSVDRAETMKLLLTRDFGLNPDRISTKGEGGTNPVAENRTSFGRSLNRRVELRINNGEF